MMDRKKSSTAMSTGSWIIVLVCYCSCLFVNVQLSTSSAAKVADTKPLINPGVESKNTEPLGGSESTIRLSQVESVKHNGDPKTFPESGGVTSIHRVWTASSSGSLDELSPEIISKLRQDVPFLAAYALRPRLVGTNNNINEVQSSSTSTSDSSSLKNQYPISTSGAQPSEEKLASSSSGRLQRIAVPARLGSDNTGILGSKLGDFNEFNVDVSSTSKSEHHHRRKTTLKKNKDNGKSNKLDGFLSELRLAHKLRSGGDSMRGLDSSRRRLKSKRQRNSASRKRIRSGTKKSRSRGGNMRRVGPKSGRLIKNAFGKQLQSANGTKGGSSREDGETRSFFATPAPGGASKTSGTENSIDDQQVRDSGIVSNEGDDKNQSSEESEADEPEPKRAGDPDVEEGGDTVTVEPKFDGVDDDPELPEGGEGENADEGSSDDDAQDTSPMKGQNESNSDDTINQSGVAGGGIGATTGTGGSASSDGENGSDGTGDFEGSSPTTSSDMDEHQNSSEDAQHGSEGGADDQGKTPFTKNSNDATPDSGRKGGSSVEFAERENDTNDDDRDRALTNGISSSGERDFGSRKKTINGDAGSENDTSNGSDNESTEEDDDRGRKTNDGSTNNHSLGETDYDDLPRHSNANDRDNDGFRMNKSEEVDDMVKSISNKPDKTNKKDCHTDHHDDGHYDHSQDHHHDHHDKSHHDKIDWLRKSIPGEPGRDYPTLSRVNTTNFYCSDQKWPGYYGDVDADCQVFHICQADGRQDSFLCPNGTIFSQPLRVCVWWNSFQCEVCLVIVAVASGNCLAIEQASTNENDIAPSEAHNELASSSSISISAKHEHDQLRSAFKEASRPAAKTHHLSEEQTTRIEQVPLPQASVADSLSASPRLSLPISISAPKHIPSADQLHQQQSKQPKSKSNRQSPISFSTSISTNTKTLSPTKSSSPNATANSNPTPTFASIIYQDAPKYYELNAKLYKQMTNLRPPSMPMVGGGRTDQDDSSDSIVKLIKSMRRNGDSAEAAGPVQSEPVERPARKRGDGASDANVDGGVRDVSVAGDGPSKPQRANRGQTTTTTNDIAPDDYDDYDLAEATPNRKGSGISDSSSTLQAPRRRRRNNSNARSAIERRRRRRASGRQGPPKLKSRRVMRNSKRNKLRHAAKPKRRA